MTPSRRRRAGRPDGDAGTSLAELLVVTVLGTLVVGLVTNMLIFSSRQTRGVNARLTDTQQARVAMDAMTRTLRAAESPDSATEVFPAAGPRDVTLYSAVNTQATPTANVLAGPSRVRFWVDSTGHLNQTLTEAAGGTAPYTYPSSGTSTRVLASHVLAGPLFTYLAQTDVSGTSTLAVDASGNLTQPARKVIFAIDIDLLVNSSRSPTVANTELRDRLTVASTYAGTVDGRGNCPTATPGPTGITWGDCTGNG